MCAPRARIRDQTDRELDPEEEQEVEQPFRTVVVLEDRRDADAGGEKHRAQPATPRDQASRLGAIALLQDVVHAVWAQVSTFPHTAPPA